MATADEVAEVRRNVDEPDDARFGPQVIAGLVDGLGVLRTSATIWRWKAAEYHKMVNISEAGSNHALSDLYSHALEMAKMYEGLAAGEDTSSDSVGSGGRAKVYVIDRE